MTRLVGKAKQRARKLKAKAIQNIKNGIPNINLFGKKHNFTTGAVFTAMDEFNKLVKVVTETVVPYDTKVNEIDFNAINYQDGEGGFFIALVPKHMLGIIAHNTNQAEVQEALSNFLRVEINDDWMMLSCYCTKDRVLGHVDRILDNLVYAFVGYSQPHAIAPLSENRDLCQALRDGVNPLKVLSLEETA